ncbi:hypothetical protein VPy01_01 [Vibrio phage VPy01]|nr:hypothetical protein VPy01_01 [Vibrio phage VPy01]
MGNIGKNDKSISKKDNDINTLITNNII